MQKLNFDDALQALNDGQYVRAADVKSSALSRVVWVAEWHIPGCLSESQTYCTNKRDAIESALNFARDSNDKTPHGMRADLMRYGMSNKIAANAYVSCAVTTISRFTLSDLLA